MLRVDCEPNRIGEEGASHAPRVDSAGRSLEREAGTSRVLSGAGLSSS